MSYPPPPPPPPPPPQAPWPPAGGRPGSGGDRSDDARELGEEPRDRSPFPLWVGLVVAGLFVLPIIAFFAMAQLMTPTTGGTEAMTDAELTFALGFSIVVQLGLFAVAIVPLLAKGWFGRPLWGSTRPLSIAIGIAVGVGGTIVAYIVMTILALVAAPEAPVEQQILQDALRGGVPTVLAIFVAVVMAPITEEVVFRGVLFRAFRGRMGVWPAAIASSLVFTVIHVEVVTSQPLALTGLFLLGVVFAIALQKSGSLLVPILAHAVFNATALALAMLADRLDLAVTLLPMFARGQ